MTLPSHATLHFPVLPFLVECAPARAMFDPRPLPKRLTASIDPRNWLLTQLCQDSPKSIAWYSQGAETQRTRKTCIDPHPVHRLAAIRQLGAAGPRQRKCGDQATQFQQRNLL